MAEKPRSFVLQPSRLGRNTEGEDRHSAARPNFTGLKESKLGVLAESKLTPTSGAIQARQAGEGGEAAAPVAKPPQTFSFAPLTKTKTEEKAKPEDEIKEKENAEAGGKFVFGQNLTERVEKAEKTDEEEQGEQEGRSSQETEDEAAETAVEAGDKSLFSGVSTAEEKEGSTKTLSEAAAEYTESQASKRKYDVVDVVTGEEEESNVLQANVKMYLFDTEKKNWAERGRGVLRLNDEPVSTPGHLRSRLVMRTVGSLRVVLNTKLFPAMVCEKANEKNVRISAMEEGEIKIFLISCSPKDADKLFTALEYRISQLTTETDSDSGPPPEKKQAGESSKEI